MKAVRNTKQKEKERTTDQDCEIVSLVWSTPIELLVYRRVAAAIVVVNSQFYDSRQAIALVSDPDWANTAK